FKWRGLFTLTLVIVEALLSLLFPLFIGFAINGLLNQLYGGLINLAALGLLMLMIGSLRRGYDTRSYAHIYQIISNEMVKREQSKKSSVSTINARATLLTEFVEFLENSVPMIVENFVGIFGVLAIIFSLNRNIFWACLAIFVLIVVVYTLSGRKNFHFNANYNNQLEKQVTTLATEDKTTIETHFRELMRWNIRLSDLETLNFSIIWLGLIGLLTYAPVAVINSGVTNYGLAFSLLMYVFTYIESVATFPFYIQQIIRLEEISSRLR
ncbi:MAG: ABC transporter six-transmembrane domain-containing protein, partial [Chloroflexota bacterium]